MHYFLVQSIRSNGSPLPLFSLKVNVRLAIFLTLSLLVSACGGGSSSGDEIAEPTINTYQLSLRSTPFDAGTTSGGGEYTEGDTVAISTTPTTGYDFENWTDTSGNVVSVDASFELTMDRTYSLRANYTLSPTVSRVSMPTDGLATDFEVTEAVPKVLFAITKEATFGDGFSGLWRSEDDGANWSQVIIGGVNFVEIAADDSNLLIAGTGASYQISTDGGLTWTSGVINDPIFGDPIFFNDAAAVTAMDGIYLTSSSGFGPGLYKSTNLGGNWSRVISESSAGSTSNAQMDFVEASPIDPDVIYTTTTFTDDILKSVNGGSSFISIKMVLSTGSFVLAEGMTLDKEATDQLLVRNNITVNGGANWTQVSNLTPSNTFFLDGDLVRFNQEAFEGFVEISRDVGASWNRVMTLIQKDGSRFYGVDAVYLAEDAVYVERGTGSAVTDQIFKVDLALLRSQIDSF